MKWIIEATLQNDEGDWIDIREEFSTRQDFDRRHWELTMNYDEPIHWKVIK